MGRRWHVRSLVRRVTGGQPAVRTGLRATEQDLETQAVTEALELALRVGEAMVSLGAAAVDVTDAVRRVLAGFGLRGAQVDLTFTAITVSAGHAAGAPPVTAVRVVTERVHDYGRLHAVEELAHRLGETRIPIELATDALARAHAELDRIVTAPQLYRRWVVTAALSGLAAGVAFLLGGGPAVALVAAATTAVIDRVVWRLARWGLPAFFTQAAGAAVAALVAVVLYLVVPLVPVDASVLPPSLVVASGVVVLLAGLSFVGAAEDAISGFPLTAGAKAFEVIVLTLGIVVGIAGVLDIARRTGVPLVLLDAPTNTSPLVVQILASGAIALAWGVASYSRPRGVVVAAGAGALAWTVFSLVSLTGVGPAVASATAAVVVGFLSETVGTRLRVPTIVTSVCGIVPLLPGSMIYRGLFRLVAEPGVSPTPGLTLLFGAASIGVALAAGVTLGEFLGRPLRLGTIRRRRPGRRIRLRGNPTGAAGPSSAVWSEQPTPHLEGGGSGDVDGERESGDDALLTGRQPAAPDVTPSADSAAEPSAGASPAP